LFALERDDAVLIERDASPAFVICTVDVVFSIAVLVDAPGV
jgi:hypothetical protein